jgi:hypothetical protein
MMNKLINLLFGFISFFLGEEGATFYTTNYNSAFVTKPYDKFKKGEASGEKKILFGQLTLSTALAVNDTIQVGKLPANSRILNGGIFVEKSLGATGILDLGHGASEDEDGNAISADPNGIVSGADAGGQAVRQESDATSIAMKYRFGAETDIYATCTEVMDGTVLDAECCLWVEFINA